MLGTCDAVLKPLALTVMCDLPRKCNTKYASIMCSFALRSLSSLFIGHLLCENNCASLDGAIPKGRFSNRTVAVSTMTLRLGALFG